MPSFDISTEPRTLQSCEAGGAMFSPSEPTQVVRMLGQFSSLRRSASGPALQPAGQGGAKRGLATRLAFDDSCLEDEPRSARKITRLDTDPFSSALGSKRFSAANSGAIAQIQEENETLKVELRSVRAALAGQVAAAAEAEGRLSKAELEARRREVEREAEHGKLQREMRADKDKVESLKLRVKRMAAAELERQESGSRSRVDSLDRSHELEGRVRDLREGRQELEEQLAGARQELASRADIKRADWQRQVQDFRHRVAELEQAEEVRGLEKERMEGKHRAGLEAVRELAAVREELARAALRTGRLEGELRANQEAVMQRQVMKDKLERFSELERENVSLRNRNQLLVETAANSALLQEQAAQQEGELARMAGRVAELDRAQAELEVARAGLKDWEAVTHGWLSPGERGGGVAAAREAVARWQQREVDYVDRLAGLQGREKELLATGAQQTERVGRLEAEVEKVKGEQEEQTKLLKRLQRKLLLVTKERDSYKGVLDSYEKEITLSGQEMDRERFAALEKTLEEYRAMVEMLEEQGKAPARTDTATGEQLTALREKNVELELELERRAIKGDFSPADTKVLHFTNNPMAQAVERQGQEVVELYKERDSLKARVQLLEDGQTKDLTIMVGQKMEEGECSQEFAKMKQDLEQADLRKQRLMEAFKKTSHDFREVVYQLTGYRIDVLANHKYRLTPLDAERPGDHLLFQKTNSGEVQMLESDFSVELGELMELHLEKHNSIPMFLAGLTRRLWRVQHGDQEDDEEDEENDEEEDDMEVQQGDSEEEEAGDGSNVSDADSEVICIDD
jgi:mitotic spindle assembly checkpoint protein MAD1